jgi:polyphenol oxidase
MKAIFPDWSDAPANVSAMTTLRSGGVSLAPYDDGVTGGNGLNLASHVGDNPDHVQQNRALLRPFLPSEPAWLTQVHGTRVVNAANVTNAPEADASISTVRGVVCATLTADCLPVLFCDTKGTVVAAAHAGWRGLAGGILEQTVRQMRDAGADDIMAWLGPAIGPETFEVGDDVLRAFLVHSADMQNAFRPIAEQPGKYLADIYLLARKLLNRIGVERISGGGMCTVTDSRRFYSFRRDPICGRMASLIWLK